MIPAQAEQAEAHGVFVAELFDETGKLVRRDTFPNTVTTVGKNLALDTFLAGSSYTVAGPFLGAISSTSWSAVAAADTMASHAGWTESTVYSARGTAAFSSASAGSKQTSAAVALSFTGSDTIKGAFLVFGTGAVSTLASTAGTLYSAGLFTGGDMPVANGYTLNVTYTASL